MNHNYQFLLLFSCYPFLYPLYLANDPALQTRTINSIEYCPNIIASQINNPSVSLSLSGFPFETIPITRHASTKPNLSNFKIIRLMNHKLWLISYDSYVMTHKLWLITISLNLRNDLVGNSILEIVFIRFLNYFKNCLLY